MKASYVSIADRDRRRTLAGTPKISNSVAWFLQQVREVEVSFGEDLANFGSISVANFGEGKLSITAHYIQACHHSMHRPTDKKLPTHA